MSSLNTTLFNELNWQFHDSTKGNFVFFTSIPPKNAIYSDIPAELIPIIRNALNNTGIDKLYSHQNQAWINYKNHQNQVIITGTSSGKSLCYQIPAMDCILLSPGSKALYIFPTKALAQDQLKSMNRLTYSLPEDEKLIQTFVFDGDTPAGKRKIIRDQADIVITNPDMLHFGILPRHNYWADFFGHLKLIVIDEIHIYRGIFGSHVANVLRRLNRICSYYGSNPVYILTSATVSNASDHACSLLDI